MCGGKWEQSRQRKVRGEKQKKDEQREDEGGTLVYGRCWCDQKRRGLAVPPGPSVAGGNDNASEVQFNVCASAFTSRWEGEEFVHSLSCLSFHVWFCKGSTDCRWRGRHFPTHNQRMSSGVLELQDVDSDSTEQDGYKQDENLWKRTLWFNSFSCETSHLQGFKKNATRQIKPWVFSSFFTFKTSLSKEMQKLVPWCIFVCLFFIFCLIYFIVLREIKSCCSLWWFTFPCGAEIKLV